jgi:hypothetical protein
MTTQDCTNVYSTNKFIVDGGGNTPYSTIQSALNAANAAGGNATVYVRPGTYTENLTLYTTVNLEGDQNLSIISGTQVIPTAGSVELKNLTLSRSGFIFGSFGTGSLTLENITITGGGIGAVIGANHTAAITFKNVVSDKLMMSVAPVSATGPILMENCRCTATATPNLFIAGNYTATINNCFFNDITTISGNANAKFNNCQFLDTANTGSNAVVEFSYCNVSSGANEAIDVANNSIATLSNVVLDSSAGNAIEGVATGSLIMGNVTFMDSKGINAVLPVTVSPAIGGPGLAVKESAGLAEKMGVATLVAGTVTVNNSSVAANSRIFLAVQTPGGTVGSPYISARVATTSFTITSTSGADTSIVAWMIVEPL